MHTPISTTARLYPTISTATRGISGLGERLDEGRQFLGAAQGDRVVVARADAAHAAVPLEAGQALGSGVLQERLLDLVRVPPLTTSRESASSAREFGG